MKSTFLTFLLSAIGTVGSVISISTDVWHAIAACLFLGLLAMTFNRTWE